MTRSILQSAAVFAAALGLACAHTSPDEMSAEAHREEAARHQRAALEEASKYDPSARATSFEKMSPLQNDGAPFLREYNPTADHLKAAELQRRHAEAHSAAAAALERFEDAACGPIAPESRSACPLLTPYVSRVEETPHGVKLTLKTGADGDQLASRMRCHLAFARAEGYPEEEAESCPLYRRGVTITKPGPMLIELSATQARTAQQLRADARALFGAPDEAHAGATAP